MIKGTSSSIRIASALSFTLLSACAGGAPEQDHPSTRASAHPFAFTETIPATQAAQGTPMQRRAAVLEAAKKGEAGLGELTAAMKDPDAMVRRAAVRCLGELGHPAADALAQAADADADPLVRRTALRDLGRIEGEKALAALSKAIEDKDAMVRRTAVETLALMQPRTAAITKLLQQAQKDKDTGVSQLANSVLWPFHKKAESVRERPEFKDHQLSVVKTIPLPADGWKFMLDPKQDGQMSKWYAADFNDKDWGTISIGKNWEEQGHANYDGVAWYRHTITLPAKPAQDGTDLVFEGVDESAWVWVNGQYVGGHDIGTAGWDQPFHADVTDVLKWGQENQITVRVLDRGFAGGIWKPVSLEVVKQ
jgi:hypothetical protein